MILCYHKYFITKIKENYMRISLDSFGGNCLERIASACDWLRQNPGGTLFIAPGIYEITGEEESRLYLDIINGKHGWNPQPFTLNPDFKYTRLFDLDGTDGVTIEADGVTLLLDGFFEPVSVRNCTGATICGLTIDYKRKPYSKGMITGTWTEGDKSFMSVNFREALGENYASPRKALYDYDSGRLSDCNIPIKSRKMLSEHEAIYELEYSSEEYVGKELYLCHFFHSRPAVLIQNASNVYLKNITIHSQPGMGITAHLSENIDIDHLSVVPSPGDHLSTTTDATHFVSCRGYLRMHGCTFDGHGDDAVNVHNYYHTLTHLGGTRYRLHCMATDGTHAAAPETPFVGDEMIVSCKGTLDEGSIYRVTESSAEDWVNVTVTLDREIEEPLDDYYISNLSACPDFTFSRCRVRNHFARSVLIKTRHAIVENCIFELSSLTPIVVSAEEGWGEGTSSSDITVRGNTFIDCAPGGDIGAVSVFTGSKNPEGIQHGRVLIENNVVIDSDRCHCGSNRQSFCIKNTREIIMSGNTHIRHE